MCLSRLFLLEKARGQGIGRSIVAYAQKLAEGDGRSRLYMRVWAKDLKAEGFCKSAASAKARPSPWKSCRRYSRYHHLGKTLALTIQPF